MAAGGPRGLRGDVYGGLTAAVVALPLALAFGVASGAGPIAGLYGAIALGFFAAVLGGTPAQVSGPTGPMTVVMAGIVAIYADSPAQAFTIVMLGGLMQLLFGVLRLGRYVVYTPASVVSGFMSGIGIIIMTIQVLPFVGLPATPGGPLASIGNWGLIPEGLNRDATLIGVMALGIMVLWPRALAAYLPAPLAALIAGTLVARFLLPGAPVLGEIPTGLPSLVVPEIDWSRLPAVVQAAFILAVLASIDSLLTSLVADSMTRTRHDSDRELVGQGVGNIVAGLIGGLPGAGATMRTVVNVKAGGNSRASGALHALVLLALVLGLAPLAEGVPLAALAGILLKVGWDIVDWGLIRRLGRIDRASVAVMLATLVLTVLVDLVTAVGVGIIVASFISAQRRESEELARITRFAASGPGDGLLTAAERELLDAGADRVMLVRLSGSFSYASARELVGRATVAQIVPEVVVYDLAGLTDVDLSAALAVEELIESRISGGHRVLVALGSGGGARDIVRLGALDAVPAEDRHADVAGALAAAAGIVKDRADGVG